MGRTCKALPKQVAREISMEVAKGTDVGMVYVKRLEHLSTVEDFRYELHMLMESVPDFWVKLNTGMKSMKGRCQDDLEDKIEYAIHGALIWQ